MNPDRFHDYEVDYSKLNSTQLAEVTALNSGAPTFNTASTFNFNAPLSGPSYFSDLVDSTYLFTNSGAWRADLNMFYSPFRIGAPDAIYLSEAYSQIKNVTNCYQYDVAPCTYSAVGGGTVLWERSCSTAETLNLDMNVYGVTSAPPYNFIANRLIADYDTRALGIAFYASPFTVGTSTGDTEACTSGEAHFRYLPDLEADDSEVKTNGVGYEACPNVD